MKMSVSEKNVKRMCTFRKTIFCFECLHCKNIAWIWGKWFHPNRKTRKTSFVRSIGQMIYQKLTTSRTWELLFVISKILKTISIQAMWWQETSDVLLEPIAPLTFRAPFFFWGGGVESVPDCQARKKYEKYAQVKLDHFPRQRVKIKIFETTTQWFMTRFIMKPYFWEGFPCKTPIHLTLHGDVLYWKMGPAVKFPEKPTAGTPKNGGLL